MLVRAFHLKKSAPLPLDNMSPVSQTLLFRHGPVPALLFNPDLVVVSSASVKMLAKNTEYRDEVSATIFREFSAVQ